MTSKTSLYNKGLFTTNMKRFWWVGFLYSIILFFTIPFKYIMYGSNLQNDWRQSLLEDTLNFFSNNNQFQRLMITVLPIALAVLLYRYLMTSKATSMIHSLPYNRRTLYLNQLSAGLVLLTSPVVLIGIIMTMLKFVTSVGVHYSMLDLLQWMGLTILFNTLFYSTAVFVGMFTGNSIAHIAFTYILHLLPVGIILFLRDNISAWLYGFSRSSFYEPFFDKLPWFVLIDYHPSSSFLQVTDILVYLFITLFLFVAAGYAYEKRKLESAGDIIAFAYFRPIFKYGLTTMGMLLGGLYFKSISFGSLSMLLLGYLLSSLLSYIIAEILIQKSFRVLHTYRGYLVYLAVISVLLVSVQLDVFGYVRRMPEFEKIDKVYFGYYSNVWTIEDLNTDPRFKDIYEANSFFNEPENIKNIMELHAKIIQKPKQKPSGSSRYIVYILKNGKYQVRQYIIDDKQYEPLLMPIYESMEYKEAKYPVVAQNPEDIKMIEIHDTRTAKKPLILANATEIQEFMSLFQEVVNTMTFKDISLQINNHATIQITDINNKSYHYGFRNDFESMFTWLIDKGYYNNLMLLPEEIEYAVLRKSSSNVHYGIYGQIVNASNTIEIREPEILKELLSISENSQYTYENVPIYVDFYIGGTYKSFYSTPLFINEHISDALKRYLENL